MQWDVWLSAALDPSAALLVLSEGPLTEQYSQRSSNLLIYMTSDDLGSRS